MSLIALADLPDPWIMTFSIASGRRPFCITLILVRIKWLFFFHSSLYSASGDKSMSPYSAISSHQDRSNYLFCLGDKNMPLYSAISSHQDCSNYLTLHPPADLFLPTLSEPLQGAVSHADVTMRKLFVHAIHQVDLFI